MYALLTSLPIWIWLIGAAALGALTVWVYWRCLFNERMTLAIKELEDAEARVAAFSARGKRATQPDAPTAPSAAAAAPAMVAATAPAAAVPATTSEGEDAGALRALRYRAWALETRLRAALDAAREGRAIDAEALSRDLDTLDASDDTPPEALSALKYRAWLGDTPTTGAAVATTDAPPPPADVLDRMKDRVARVIAAAKAGRLQDLAAIEAEADADPSAAAPLSLARAAGLAFDPIGDRTAPALEYRNWLMAGWLERLIGARRAGRDFDADAVEADLKLATVSYGFLERPAAAAEPARETVAPPPPAPDALARLEAEAGALRFRRHLLARRLGEVTLGLREGRRIDPDGLVAALAADGERLEPATDAPRPAFVGPVAAAAPAAAAEAPDRAAREDAASLRYRLWLVQSELKRLRRDREQAEPARLAETAAEATTLRDRLQAAQLRLETLERDGAEAERRAAEAALRPVAAEQAAARARLWAAEWRAQTMRQRAERLEARMIERDRALGDDASALRRRSTQAETALRDERRLGVDGAAARAAAAAEAEALRERLRALDAQTRDAAEARARGGAETERLAAEVEALRGRLALAEAEVERLRARPEPAPIAVPIPAPIYVAPAPAPVAPTPRPDPFAERAAARRAAEPIAPVAPLRTRADGRWRRAPIAADIGRVLSAPRSGAEEAARELVERGVLGAERPRALSAAYAIADAPDDLQLIEDVSPETERALAELGLRKFEQLAEMTPADLAWLDLRLGLGGAVVRERWFEQAKRLVDLRRRGRIALGPDGLHTLTAEPSAPPRPAYGEPAEPPTTISAEALAETIETVPPHPEAVAVGGPLWGVEMAALDLIESRGFAADALRPPAALATRADGPADDLTRLRGVGPRLAAALRGVGVARYAQIADLDAAAAAWLDRRLGLGGRVARDRWIPQARALADARLRPATPVPTPAPAAAPTPGGDGPGWLATDVARGPQDDLTRIDAIGPKLEARLNELGLRRYAQLARMSEDELGRLDATLGLAGRALREGWREQAARLGGVAAPAAMAPAPAPTPSVEAGWSAAEREALERLAAGPERAGATPPRGLLARPVAGRPDDLTSVRGVTPALMAEMNALGLFHLWQLAALDGAGLAWLDASLGLGGRSLRERWAWQAATLDTGRR